jgi:hypothetical protein
VIARLGASLLVVAAVAAGCGGEGRENAAGTGKLVPITDVRQVGDRFDRDSGRPRLVLLLSPT